MKNIDKSNISEIVRINNGDEFIDLQRGQIVRIILNEDAKETFEDPFYDGEIHRVDLEGIELYELGEEISFELIEDITIVSDVEE